MVRPPRLAEAILRFVVDAEDRRFLLSDLAEEFENRVKNDGPRPAYRWYWRQALGSIVPSIRRRLTKTRRVGPVQGYNRHHRLPVGRKTMDLFFQDVRFALRTLRRRPGFAAVAVLTLSLGIGANTAVFSVVNGVLFKGVPELDRTSGLVEVTRDLDGAYFDVSYPVFQQLRENSETVEDMAAFTAAPVSVGSGGEPFVAMGLSVTGNYFSMLGLIPERGRFFRASESFFPNVASTSVISTRLWSKAFDSAEDVIGKTLMVNGHATTVIAVTPEGFHGHMAGLQIGVWVPVGLAAPGMPRASSLGDPFIGSVEILARLAEGRTAAEARAELSLLADQFMMAQSADDFLGADVYVVRVEKWEPVPSSIRTPVKAFFAVLMVMVGIVLVIASTNVANMLLSRSVERTNEIAVRRAIGAGRARIVRQLVTEALVLFMLAGGIGALVAGRMSGIFMAFEPPLPPGVTVDLDLGTDWRVMIFSLSVSLVAGLLFSLAPALHATKAGLMSGLKDGGSSSTPQRSLLRELLVAGQVAVTLVLLIGAGLFARALTSIKSMDTGFDAEGVHIISLDLELGGSESVQRGSPFFRELSERARALPGVESAALARKLPFAGASTMGDVNVPGVPAPEGRGGHTAFFNTVTPGYFVTLRIPLITGRDISEGDNSSNTRVAVINRAMADRFWPDGDGLGKLFYIGPVGQERAFEVIGVVENAKYGRMTENTPNFYYVPFQQRYNAQMSLFLRTTGNAEAIVEETRRIVRDLDPALPILDVRSLSEATNLALLPQRLAAWVAGAMGIIGLLLAAVGVYGVTAFAISQRAKEIGVRIALGATRTDLLKLLVFRGMAAPVLGMVIGGAAALAVTRFLTMFLGGVSPTDPVAFLAVSAGLLGVALVATVIPIRKASKLDVVATLRSE